MLTFWGGENGVEMRIMPFGALKQSFHRSLVATLKFVVEMRIMPFGALKPHTDSGNVSIAAALLVEMRIMPFGALKLPHKGSILLAER